MRSATKLQHHPPKHSDRASLSLTFQRYHCRTFSLAHTCARKRAFVFACVGGNSMNQRDQFSRSESLRHEACARAAQHVGLVLFDGCCLPNASAISEAFRLANQFETSTGGQPAYRLSLLSSTGGNIATSSAISIWTNYLDG